MFLVMILGSFSIGNVKFNTPDFSNCQLIHILFQLSGADTQSGGVNTHSRCNGKSKGFGGSRYRFHSGLHLFVVWPWTSYPASLNLSFQVCIIEMMITHSTGLLSRVNKMTEELSSVPGTEKVLNKWYLLFLLAI